MYQIRNSNSDSNRDGIRNYQKGTIFVRSPIKIGIMHTVISFFTALIVCCGMLGESSFTAVEQAFNKQDAAKIVSYGKEKMLMQIQGKEGAYAPSQATQLLKDFFTRKPVSSFHFTYKGKDTEDAPLTTGTYKSKDESFRVTLKWKRNGGDLKIEALTIE